MKIIDCKSIAKAWKDEIKKQNLPARLCVIQAGDDPASEAYIRGKKKDCEEVGFECIHKHIPAYTAVQVFNEIIDALLEIELDETIHGVIVQLPLPFGLTFDDIKSYVPIEKDVDGFLNYSFFDPCTPGGIMTLLKDIGVDVAGKHCVIIGRSDIVGKPLARMMTEANATVTLCHSKTTQETLKFELSAADIVVSATGHYGAITTRMCKKNSIIIDVGVNRNEEHLCGDVEIYEDDEVNITPVPGGVGLLTRAMLMRNVAKAYKIQNGDM